MGRSIVCACVCVAFLANRANADLIAYWNFNGFDGSATTIPASLGSGNITVTGFPDANLQNLSGSTVNALGGDPAGLSLTLESNANNGDFITLSFSMVGHKDLVLTYASRRTTTGFNSNQWSYSTDGVLFTPFGAAVDPTSGTAFAITTRDFSSVLGLNEATDVYLRYTLNGATASTGNTRIDNIQLNANSAAVVPEPSSIVPMGIGLVGMLFARRRRVAQAG
jgi:hypothetical protein